MTLPLLRLKLAFRLRFCLVMLLPAVVSLGLPQAVRGQCVQRAASEPEESTGIETTVENLRQISRELGEAVGVFHQHLDDVIARYDHGYRASNGNRAQGADADLSKGRSDILPGAIRKLAIARMLGAQGPTYAPQPLADVQHIQDLICEAKEKIESSDGRLRQLLVVSAKDLSSKKQAELSHQHAQLLKGRRDAQEAVKTTLLALPIDLTGVDPDQAREQVWEFLVLGQRQPHAPLPDPDRAASGETRRKPAELLPIRLQWHKRISLIVEPGYRIALTDSGTEDREGRHIFYQEQWIQRPGGVVLRMRWRVGVDILSGQHVLIKQYRPVLLDGDVDELYQDGRDYLWYLEPSEESAEPSRQEVESAIQQVARSREEMRAAVQDFRISIRDALNRSGSALDAGLPDELRERLFAIRGHMARAPGVLEAERSLRHAVQQASESITRLEPLAAWANRTAPDDDSRPALSAFEWQDLQDRADAEIASTRSVSHETRNQLPPDTPDATAEFPALLEHGVVRILRRHTQSEPNASITFLQEIWRGGPQREGYRPVQRTATVISIDLKTGGQRLVTSGAKYYTTDRDGSLEDTFNRYAGQDPPLQALGP